MDPALIFRPAVDADLPRIVAIIRQAQAQMRAAGSRQWQDGYPARTDIAADIAHGCGYVLQKRDTPEPDGVIAYGALVFDGEPAYGHIEGKWLTDGAYMVLHRLAVADGEKRRGVATEFMHRAETLARGKGVASFRIDTNYDNIGMLHMTQREGFVFCGKIRHESGERLAFEKRL